MRYLGGGVGHLKQFPPASPNNQDITPYDISDEDVEETGNGDGSDKAGHGDGSSADKGAEDEDEEKDNSGTEEADDEDQGESSDEETGNVY